MPDYKRIRNLAGWLVFTIALIVYYLSAERSGSLWDCGEFILGAYKLQVVHPPGAPLFILVGRLFAWMGDILSSNPENIAFAVNLLSGVCTAFTAAFVAWSTMIMGKLAMLGRKSEPNESESIALGFAGVVGGLSTAFASSIWFSAVEGEVYAMSTLFTAMTMWAAFKWYELPDRSKSDRWLVFSLYAAGLSLGVHLLSLLTFPAIALLYYFKKYKKHTFLGGIVAMGIGAVTIGVLQKLIITGLPWLWSKFELIMVNDFGMPFHSGLIPVVLLLGAVGYFGIRYAHRKNNQLIQLVIVSTYLIIIAFSTIGTVVIRANANPPINMNEPSDAMRLLPYINREQYGERPLLKGPAYDARPIGVDREDRYGRVGDKYEIIDQKFKYKYAAKDKVMFPRMGHSEEPRPTLYKWWTNNNNAPTGSDNIGFFFKYQVAWMYWRYFMWNFSGRQNGKQGYESWDPRTGHWLTGIDAIDGARLVNQSELPETMKKAQARNKYYMLPFLFGLLGVLFHYRKKRKDFLVLLSLFFITGIGIIIYSNQPPREPRERDYVLVGSFFTYAMWIGMGVLALFEILKQRISNAKTSAILAGAIVLIAPFLMGTQNFDDMSRKNLKGARDYANNFLNSCEKNAILFTYGDNDTYPLWYAQEVEGIRTDVRVVNMSLISVDWYINQLRRRINDSAPIKLSIPEQAYIGSSRLQAFIGNSPDFRGNNLVEAIKYFGESHPTNLSTSGGARSAPSVIPRQKLSLPVDKNKAIASGMVGIEDSTNIVSSIPIDLTGKQYLLKGDVAIMDIIASNFYDRPIYFATTSSADKLIGFQNYTQLEGLALRIIPVRSNPDPTMGGSIYGLGRINIDAFHENVTQKWRWGNFDKYDMHVEGSFTPSTTAMRNNMQRTAIKAFQEQKTQIAVDIVDKFFEGFPNMNFPYDNYVLPFISLYAQTGEEEKAKKHLRILATEMADHMNFYLSLDPTDRDDVNFDYKSDFDRANSTIRNIAGLIAQINDANFTTEINNIIGPYISQPTQN